MVKHSQSFFDAIEYAKPFSRNKRLIAEEYISGCQYHGDGFVVDGRLINLFLGDHQYNSSINPFVPYSTLWPSSGLTQEYKKKIIETVQVIITESGYQNGPINVEARVSKGGDVFIMEIGPRSGGNFVPQAIAHGTGFDPVKETLNELEGRSVSRMWHDFKIPMAIYVIHSASDGILERVDVSSEIKPLIIKDIRYTKPGEPVSRFMNASSAIGVLILSFPSIKTALELFPKMNQLVHVYVKDKK